MAALILAGGAFDKLRQPDTRPTYAGELLFGVDVVVPEGVNVRNETVAIFGGSDVKNITPAPGGPTVILKGLVLFGGIDAKGKRRH